MHISLDAALQRQPLLSTVGDKLLPTFPGATAAYSLRALNGDANDVLRVRRSSDNAEEDFTAEGVALELEDWVGAGNDGFVETWYDQSGNDNHAVQDFEADQPKIVSAGSLLDGITYDGSGQQLVGTASASAYDVSLFSVIKPANTSQFAVSGSARLFNFSLDGTDNRFYFGNSGTTLFARFGSSGPHFSSHTLTTDEILLSARANASSAGIFVDGAVVGSFTPTVGGTGITSQSIRITGSTSDAFEGVVKEVILYQSDQSANRTGIESNIADYYGITLS